MIPTIFTFLIIFKINLWEGLEPALEAGPFPYDYCLMLANGIQETLLEENLYDGKVLIICSRNKISTEYNKIEIHKR